MKSEDYNHNSVFYICKNHVVDINDSTYNIMKKLNYLYETRLYLQPYNNDCENGVKCYENYIELVSMSQELNNKSFNDVLGNYKNQYNTSIKKWTDWTEYSGFPKILYSSYGTHMHKLSFTSLISVYTLSFIRKINFKEDKENEVKKKNKAKTLNNLFDTEQINLCDIYHEVLYNTLI
ncbi:variable surface protein [Plasmodium gonderi]|uniref:Variable surface protein n=1 Tax=Plasmodium gonderi TaxID=77519 RepID=A0A1Y1JQD4_PLAGO|nr:variable surface protein [Plasmodium gonderi]GAW84400.1 variable surface protein [Plasmodium gonderi]